MTDTERWIFLTLVREMRAAQKRWFKNRQQADLVRSKELERDVDRAIDAELAPRAEPSLFDRMGTPE